MIVLILMQHGKGADAGAAFGSGASGTVFGSRGSGNFLSRTTAILATVFFVNCIALAWIVSHRNTTPTSIMDSATPSSVTAPKVEVVPAKPATPANSEVPTVPGQSAPASSEVPKPVVAPAASTTPATAAEVPAAPAATETKPATPATGEAATTEQKKP